jgi:hypothetical protein
MPSGREFVVMHTTPSMFATFLVVVWTKNILYRVIEGQTHFGMSIDSNISLALNELIGDQLPPKSPIELKDDYCHYKFSSFKEIKSTHVIFVSV